MKTFFSMLLGLLLLAGVSVENGAAQAAPNALNAGMVNGKATRLPKPEYSDALRQAGIEGMVAVNVIIDEAGNVIEARAEIYDQRVRTSGDGIVLEPVVLDLQLRRAAEDAALGARFSPTVLSGTPVRVKGKLVYIFSAASKAIGGVLAGKINSDPTTGKVTGQVIVSPDVSNSGSSKLVSSENVLNGKAISLPKPDFPAAARAVNASGAVVVQVTIDEEGSVISASVVSGHPLLRSPSEAAARAAKFAPTVVDGKTVKVTGVLTYFFAP